MLKTRNLVILGVILVVLAGINFMQKSSHRKSTSGSAVAVILPGEITKDTLSRITLGFGPEEDLVVLSASPGGWLVDTAFDSPADEDRIDTLLRNLGNLSGEFRSDKASVLADYGLDDESSVKIRAFDTEDAVVLAVDVGKTPERFPGNFVRQPDSDAVYLSQKGVLSHLGIYGPPAAPTSKHFLKLQAVSEDRLEIDRIVLRDGDTTVDLLKEFALEPLAEDAPEDTEPVVDRMTWEWKLNLDNGAPLAKTKVDAILGAVVSVRATEVADPAAPAAEYGLAAPLRTATLHRQDGTQVVLEFGNSRPAEGSQAAGTYMRIHGDPSIWLVTDYTTRNIFKTVEELAP